MWHECGQQCANLHGAFLQKILSIVRTARTPANLKVSQSPGLGQEIDFDLLNEVVTTPSMHSSNDWRDPLELFTVLDLSPAVRSSATLFFDSPRGPQPVPVDLGGIILEHWSVRFEPRPPEEPIPPSAQHMELHARMLIRTIYSLTRLLPVSLRALTANSTVTTLSSSSSPPPSQLSISLQGPSDLLRSPQATRRGLDESIAGESEGGAYEAASLVQLAPLLTPHGSFHLTIRYRRNCSFVWRKGVWDTAIPGATITKDAGRGGVKPRAMTVRTGSSVPPTAVLSKMAEIGAVMMPSKEDDPGSFENVELEPVVPLRVTNSASGDSGHDPSSESQSQGQSQAASSPSTASPGSNSTSRATRSKSLHNVTSPLAVNPMTDGGQRRASSPAVATGTTTMNMITNSSHSRSGSSLAEDSQLAQFIREMDRRPTLTLVPAAPPLDLPSPDALREAYEQTRTWLRAQIRNHETRSKLMFSPLMERHELPSDDNSSNNNHSNGHGDRRANDDIDTGTGTDDHADADDSSSNNNDAGRQALGHNRGNHRTCRQNDRKAESSGTLDNGDDPGERRESGDNLMVQSRAGEEEPFIFDFAESK